MSNFETLREIGEKFRLEGELYSVDVITNGNINSTYKVTYRKGSDYLKSYIFQRVNTGVFHNPIDIMENIDKVTTYMREHFPNDVCLHFHHTDTGENYYIIDDFFWRVMNYVDSITFNTLDDLTVIASVGEAFGKFQMQLAGFDGSLLHETIPNFHNTHKRLDKFLKTVEEDPCGRVKDALPEILYIKSVKETAENLSLRYDSGEIPKRVTHNDTKANNVLFDRDTKRPIVVIDLDTVMPGMSMYDFGDAVRFIASTAAEDEPDIRRIFFDTGKFRAFAKGFLSQVKGALTKDEIDNLVLATFSITIELASRFLDDYLSGDTYFKVNYPGHNLVRTRAQIALAKDILRKSDELNWIVQEIARR
jgi:N-acetylhexosamine 1-kinase